MHIVSTRRRSGKRLQQQLAFWTFRILGLGVAGLLVWILGFLIWNGAGVLSWDFLTLPPTDGMTGGGIFPALVGTCCLVVGSMAVAFPLGLMSAVYTTEYARKGPVIQLIRVMTNNLSGIPSIIFGLFGMSLFVNTLGWGDSILAGSFTLGLLTLPLVIRTTEEALRAVPQHLRSASLALGATRLQTLWRVTLPCAFPHILTGLILSIGRVSGETAPILFTCAAYFLPKLPSGIFDQVMALPYHLYVTATSGTDLVAARPLAYGTALVLIALVFAMNLLAWALRRHLGRKVKTQ